jgi:hypothetical protein
MTARTRSSKVLLVAHRRADSAVPETAGVRRYRLARLRFDSRQSDRPGRLEHLKRI